jgi:glycosyltransferase involved in cell wall biosynthesis
MEISVVVEQLRQRVPGGIGTYARGLVAGLVALEDDDLSVTALASRAVLPDPLDELGVEVRAARYGHRMQMAVWDLGRGRVCDGDVLHLTSLAGPDVAPGGPIRTVMVHDLAWRTNPELTTARGRRWHEAALRRVVASPATLLVPSEPVALELCRTGVASERIHVVGEGADHLPPPSSIEASEMLAAAGVSGPFLLSVSTLEPRKNLARLVSAHARAQERSSEVPDLVVVGPAGWGDTLEASSRVHLLGRVGDGVLAALLTQCEGFVYVPISEGFGLPPLEAMAHGAPVVASSTTPSMAAAPVVSLVEPDDDDAIVDGLVLLAAGRASQATASEAGRAFAGQHRWVDVAAAHLALWRELR